MIVTKDNIEEVVFEHLEGNLTATETTELMAFLEQHPEHQETLQLWQQTYLGDELPAIEPDFSSLEKKSNKGLLIAGGIAATALLIWGTAQWTSEEDLPAPAPATEVSAPATKENNSLQIEDASMDDRIRIMPEDRAITPTVEEQATVEQEEVAQPLSEDIDPMSQRDVKLMKTQPSRKVVTQTTTEAEAKSTKPNSHRSKEVNVIELNSEGL